MKDLKLLVVDDDDLITQSIQMALPEHWSMVAHNSPYNLPEGEFNAAFVDMHLKGNPAHAEGLEVIREMRQKNPHIEIVAMSGNLDRDLMESCLKMGASRYFAKPLSVDELNLTLDKIEALFLLQSATRRGRGGIFKWIGNSDVSKKIQRDIASFCGEGGPILIEGESGTGKEVVSGIINEQEHSERPFIRVNIAAIPETLFESELFGHVRGAFTGADQNKMGLAEAAHNGDLFLDEIEALSLPLQVKLLRFLETGEVRRVGSQNTIQVHTRVIVATNRSLNEMAHRGEFREDLLWRLKGKIIHLPPLRERVDDIDDLAEYFMSLDPIRKKQIEPEALQALKTYEWPGNIRELKRVCEQLMLHAPLPFIRQEDVIQVLTPSQKLSQGEDQYRFLPHLGLSENVARFESHIIQSCLKKQKDIDEACKALNISRSNLYKKIKDYQIEWRN